MNVSQKTKKKNKKEPNVRNEASNVVILTPHCFIFVHVTSAAISGESNKRAATSEHWKIFFLRKTILW